MTLIDLMKLVAAITLAFGSGAVVVIGLSKWLGDLWAARILQDERAKIERHLSEHAHELGLAKSSYDHYLDLILNYYKLFYQHYRLCQRASYADGHEKDDGTITSTKDEFFEKLDYFLTEWAEREGKIRLLLPAPILATHMEAVTAFNSFKRVMQKFDSSPESHKAKFDSFVKIDDVKKKLEQQLRDFLRTEKLLK